jgi:NDP-sugar pyrophosphorylase family protein
MGATKPNAAVHGNRVTSYDKETMALDVQYVDYGLSAFTARAFDAIPADEPTDLGLVNKRLIAANQLAAYVVDDLPFEIGSPQGLEATRSFLRRPRDNCADHGNENLRG